MGVLYNSINDIAGDFFLGFEIIFPDPVLAVNDADFVGIVAKPGARLLVLDFGKPDNGAWRACYFAYLRSFVPVFGKLFCGDSATHAYILESLKHYPAQRGVADAMKQLGCRDVRIVNLVGGAMSINYGVKAT